MQIDDERQQAKVDHSVISDSYNTRGENNIVVDQNRSRLMEKVKNRSENYSNYVGYENN